MLMFPSNGIEQADVYEFNAQSRADVEDIKDFIILHYHQTERTDTPFWRYCKNMPIPDTLAHRMDLFAGTGKVFKKAEELFGETSWIQVMLGQGIMPKQYHPIVDMMSDDELQRFLNNIKANVKRKVANWPDVNDFIRHYCQSQAAQ